MNTTEVAAHLGTTPRTLRQFLRSPQSTFIAVGSGSRYEFDMTDMPTLERRFREWNRKAASTADRKQRPKSAIPVTLTTTDDRTNRDQEVWAEEGDIVIEDIRLPGVRARVKREAQEANDRLMMMLMRAGLHITQTGWDRGRKPNHG